MGNWKLVYAILLSWVILLTILVAIPKSAFASATECCVHTNIVYAGSGGYDYRTCPNGGSNKCYLLYGVKSADLECEDPCPDTQKPICRPHCDDEAVTGPGIGSNRCSRERTREWDEWVLEPGIRNIIIGCYGFSCFCLDDVMCGLTAKKNLEKLTCD